MNHKKVLLIILLLSFLSIGKIFPQDSTLFQPETKNYIQYLEKENKKSSEKDLMNQPLDSIKKIAGMWYQAGDKDYIGIHRYLKSRKGLGGVTFQTIYKMLGPRVTELIQIGYLLEMKINSINKVEFHSPSGFTYPRVEINATILDAIKGSNKLKPGDSITFVYNGYLRRTDYNFQKGETIFAGIRIDDDKNVITNFLYYKNNEKGKDASYGRYPIENGILIDRNNVWGYGKSVPWKELK